MQRAIDPSRPQPRSSVPVPGFMSVELLIVLAVTGVLLSLALPSLGAMTDAQRVRSASSLLLSDLHLVRSEAIKRNGRVALCKSFDARQCTTVGGWEQGWLVFHDQNNNGQVDAGEGIVQQRAGALSGVRLRGNSPVASYVSYTASGVPRLVSGAFQAGTLTVCPQSPDATATVRRIIIGAPGRPRVVPGLATDCV
ncbi:MAG: GspH/FimT family pseudopilin [Rhodoferax sp.]